MKLAGWGRYPWIETQVADPRDEAGLRAALRAGPLVARGNGRAYGDSAIGAGQTVRMRHLNRMIAFDDKQGQLVAEAGVLLSDIITTFLPRGWFPMVTPGTKFVTLGGMIAADVHGKNHHVDGSMRACVDWVELMGPNGKTVRCGPGKNAELFDWTLGGMGLTGIILRVAIRLRPVESAWIVQQLHPAKDLDAAMTAFEDAHEATYSVAWIDCLSRGAEQGRALMMLGEHATQAELRPGQAAFDLAPKRHKSVPFDFPGFALNPLSVRAFNALYWQAGLRRAGTSLVSLDSYFYPLDSVLGWNRIYGRRGFVQFQCALPLAGAEAGLRALLRCIAEAGTAPFLSVLKRLGAQDSRFAFPMEGYTLALDFPVNSKTLAMMDQLDAITIDHGGRFYLAKDACLRAETLRAADPRAGAFAAMRAKKGLQTSFRSAQSERLDL